MYPKVSEELGWPSEQKASGFSPRPARPRNRVTGHRLEVSPLGPSGRGLLSLKVLQVDCAAWAVRILRPSIPSGCRKHLLQNQAE